MKSEKPFSEQPSKFPTPDLATGIDGPPRLEIPATKSSALKTFGLVFLILLLLIAVGAGGWYWYYFHARAFAPVNLSKKEQLVINDKIELAGGDAVFVDSSVLEPNDRPIIIKDAKSTPVPSKEDRRTIIFTEKEINGVLHHNTELADKLYIDLKKDGAIARIVFPVPEDVAVVGGKTLRANITIRIFLDENRQLQLTLDDVTVSGIPLPNAWLFDLKNKNLIDLDSSPEGTGLLKLIADGIEDFKIENGQIKIRLSE